MNKIKKFPESFRANMGGERVRSLQAHDDTEEFGAPASGFEDDRAEVRTDTGLADPRREQGNRPGRRDAHGGAPQDRTVSIYNRELFL